MSGIRKQYDEGTNPKKDHAAMAVEAAFPATLNGSLWCALKLRNRLILLVAGGGNAPNAFAILFRLALHPHSSSLLD
jgi:hypothetical protein